MEPRLAHTAVELAERDASVSRLGFDLVERHVRAVLKQELAKALCIGTLHLREAIAWLMMPQKGLKGNNR